MLHFPSMQAPLAGGLKSAGPKPFGHLQSRTGWAGVHAHALQVHRPVFPAFRGDCPENAEISYLVSCARAARQGAPDMLAISIFNPGPMVEDSDTRLM